MDLANDRVDFRLQKAEFEGRKQTILEFNSLESDVCGFIVVDSLALGPATGGCRFTNYTSRSEALYDAQRLARGMSFKNAMADLPLGGGKSVIMKPAGAFDRELALEVFALALNHLKGSYLAAEDVGTSEADMERIQQTSPFVFGLPRNGEKAGGNPSPRTAQGVFLSIIALLQLKNIDPSKAHITVQGLGSVGRELCVMLLDRGAILTVADIDEGAASVFCGEPRVSVVDTESIHRVSADLFAPCALGAGLNVRTIPELGASIIAGAANNQLERAEDALLLAKRDILYAPDFIVNAGGIINVACEYLGEGEDQVERRVSAIPGRLIGIIHEAQGKHLTPSQIADMKANEKIAAREPV
jgi:leucine dehydrogenase